MKMYFYFNLQFLISIIVTEAVIGMDGLKTVFQLDQVMISNATNDHGFNISISEGQNFSKGFSLCLRANFKVWNERCIFYTDSLTMRLKDYTKEIGGINLFEKYYFFKWSDKELISNNAWSSICLSFNSTDSTAKLFINGEMELSIGLVRFLLQFKVQLRIILISLNCVSKNVSWI